MTRAPGPVPLSRAAFRTAVFARDGGRCVLCSAPAVDAHHMLERRLWPDGGYHVANGASVCEDCHLRCERTLVSVEELRALCGIAKPLIPPHLYDDQSYDKWGNPILANGQRCQGELFFEESVQQVLREGNVLHLFTDRIKYPRTHHLPWSPGISDDDRVIESLADWGGERLIVTEKMDGENTTMYRRGIHARSVDGRHHLSRNWVKQFHGSLAHDIPTGWRICGENLYARHSIAYTALPSFFLGFSMWNERNVCLPWDETVEWFALLGITPVPVLYDGDLLEFHDAFRWDAARWSDREGYVVRWAGAIGYAEFRRKVAKYVRAGHVQTSPHWMEGRRIVPNQLASRTDP